MAASIPGGGGVGAAAARWRPRFQRIHYCCEFLGTGVLRSHGGGGGQNSVRRGGGLGMRALSPEHPYYAVTVLDKGDSNYVCIGVNHSGASMSRMPGKHQVFSPWPRHDNTRSLAS